MPVDGNIIITKSKRKTYSIEINSKGEIKVRVPNNFTDKNTKEILEKHKKWIEKTIQRREDFSLSDEENKLFNIEEFLLNGKWLKIKIMSGSRNRIVVKDRELLVFSQNNSKEYLRALITLFFKNMAREKLALRLIKLSKESGLKYDNFKISSAKKRWGSCSGAKNINLNWRLIMLPENLCDSVIYHELSHLRVMDHSSNFYNLLKDLDSEYKFHNLELKNYSFILGY
jgi:predicted metal-dependent hydrolase